VLWHRRLRQQQQRGYHRVGDAETLLSSLPPWDSPGRPSTSSGGGGSSRDGSKGGSGSTGAHSELGRLACSQHVRLRALLRSELGQGGTIQMQLLGGQPAALAHRLSASLPALAAVPEDALLEADADMPAAAVGSSGRAASSRAHRGTQSVPAGRQWGLDTTSLQLQPQQLEVLVRCRC